MGDAQKHNTRIFEHNVSDPRPGQLFLRQQIPQNTFPPATAVLAPFQPLQPAQAGCSGTAPLPLAPTPPETPEPQEASESGNSGKAGRGYGKWGEEEEKLLVQLWCDKHMRLELRHARQVWEEIAQEISKIRKVTSAQCQRKMKYLKDRYKEAKDHNRHKTGGERKTSPFYDKIDSVLGKKSSAAAPAHESIYEQFYASNAIIKGQVVIQNNYLFDVIIIARFRFLLI